MKPLFSKIEKCKLSKSFHFGLMGSMSSQNELVCGSLGSLCDLVARGLVNGDRPCS